LFASAAKKTLCPCSESSAIRPMGSGSVSPQEMHKGLEAMSMAANAMKDEEWGEAERALMEVQEITGRLLREVGDKAREKMLAPPPDVADRG
jgi:hypothetical protein